MEHISDSINKLYKSKSPTSQRAYVLQRICDDLFTQDDFKKIMGQTSKMTVPEIIEIFDQARSWQKNPQALFWKLVREKQKEIGKQIN